MNARGERYFRPSIIDLAEVDAVSRPTSSDFRGEILKGQDRRDTIGQAIALQEFISWTLTNQNLSDSLKTTNVKTPLKKRFAKS